MLGHPGVITSSCFLTDPIIGAKVERGGGFHMYLGIGCQNRNESSKNIRKCKSRLKLKYLEDS